MIIKKLSLILLTAVMVGACSSGSKVTVEEAEKAFIVGFVVIFSASMDVAFGNAPAGVSLSDDEKILTIENYDLSELGDLGYTEVSGSVVEDGGARVVDLSLVGGPVKTIKYELTEALDTSRIQMTIEANGSEVEIDISEADFDALEGN